MRHWPCLLFLTALLPLFSGCQKPLRPGLVNDAAIYYDRGQYAEAYSAAAAVAQRGQRAERDEAALIAGLAARQQGNLRQAERYLLQAARSRDAALTGEALSSLGLVYAQQERHEESAQALLRAAEYLTGQSKANAYFYAAVAQQKLGRWAQARTNLVLARSAATDATFVSQVDQQIDVSGWTLQLGAFSDSDNARQTAQRIADRAREATLGSPRIIEVAGRDGMTLSVVQVGQFTTFKSASRARDRLGQDSAIIVPLAGR